MRTLAESFHKVAESEAPDLAIVRSVMGTTEQNELTGNPLDLSSKQIKEARTIFATHGTLAQQELTTDAAGTCSGQIQ